MRELWFYEGPVRLDPTSTLTPRIVKKMLALNPYATWPLHVKLFTAEAEKFWGMLAKAPAYRALPRGLTATVELEGVDGQSGNRGSGRTGPVDVADSK